MNSFLIIIYATSSAASLFSDTQSLSSTVSSDICSTSTKSSLHKKLRSTTKASSIRSCDDKAAKTPSPKASPVTPKSTSAASWFSDDKSCSSSGYCSNSAQSSLHTKVKSINKATKTSSGQWSTSKTPSPKRSQSEIATPRKSRPTTPRTPSPRKRNVDFRGYDSVEEVSPYKSPNHSFVGEVDREVNRILTSGIPNLRREVISDYETKSGDGETSPYPFRESFQALSNEWEKEAILFLDTFEKDLTHFKCSVYRSYTSDQESKFDKVLFNERFEERKKGWASLKRRMAFSRIGIKLLKEMKSDFKLEDTKLPVVDAQSDMLVVAIKLQLAIDESQKLLDQYRFWPVRVRQSLGEIQILENQIAYKKTALDEFRLSGAIDKNLDSEIRNAAKNLDAKATTLAKLDPSLFHYKVIF